MLRDADVVEEVANSNLRSGQVGSSLTVSLGCELLVHGTASLSTSEAKHVLSLNSGLGLRVVSGRVETVLSSQMELGSKRALDLVFQHSYNGLV